MRSQVEPLQKAMDHDDHKALSPIGNKREFFDVSADMLCRAAFSALWMGA